MFSAHPSTCIACLLLCLLAEGFAKPSALRRFEYHQPHMGTEFRIVLYSMDSQTADRAAQAALARVARLDATMSDYNETSELNRLCRTGAGRWVKVSPDLFRALALGQQIARQTHGAFDVTVGQLSRLWRRARRTGTLPDSDRLAQALALTGYDHVRLDPSTCAVRLSTEGVQLDLGGIAKGYAADEAMKVLRRYGIGRALIAAGGDIRVSAAPPAQRGWTIEVAAPPLSLQGTTRLVLAHAAVSTSGEAEQFVEIEGVRYSHIVNPKTGVGLIEPISVTVVAPYSVLADAYATAVSVLGVDAGLRVIERKKDFAALIIRREAGSFRAVASERWHKLPKLESPERKPDGDRDERQNDATKFFSWRGCELVQLAECGWRNVGRRRRAARTSSEGCADVVRWP